MSNKKLLVIGNPKSGKDEFCRFLQLYGVSSISSSMHSCDLFLFDILRDKFGYRTKEECYKDRRNHRLLWKKLISAFNKNDKTLLTKSILSSYDCYNGMRDIDEFLASRGVFDLVVWIDRKGTSRGVNDLTKDMADVIVLNNKSLKMLEAKASVIASLIKYEGK